MSTIESEKSGEEGKQSVEFQMVLSINQDCALLSRLAQHSELQFFELPHVELLDPTDEEAGLPAALTYRPQAS